MAKPKNENELRLVRIYNAPVQLVWEMWTEDKHATKWWGPRGFTITTKSKDLKPEGKWIYTMHGPDGVDYPNITTYLEVKKYSRLVYDHGATEDQQALFRVTVTFEECNGTTVMDLTMAFKTPDAAKGIAKLIKKANGNSTWDRFAEYIEGQTTKNDIFVINRSFHAPQKSVFEMWTSPKHFASWMGPTGSTMEIIKADVREGGSLHYVMDHTLNHELYGMVKYKIIRPNNLLIYSQNFSDKNGDLVKPSFAPSWPDSMLTTIEFHEESSSETRVTLRWEVHGAANEIERKTFHDAKSGMTDGWEGSFDKLEEALNHKHS